MKRLVKMGHGVEWTEWRIGLPGIFSLRWVWDEHLPLYFTFKAMGFTVMTKNYHGWEARLTVKFLGKVIRR